MSMNRDHILPEGGLVYYSIANCRAILNAYSNSLTCMEAFESVARETGRGMEIVKLDDFDGQNTEISTLLLPISNLHSVEEDASADEILLGLSSNCVLLTNKDGNLTSMGKLMICSDSITNGGLIGERFKAQDLYKMCLMSIKSQLKPHLK